MSSSLIVVLGAFGTKLNAASAGAGVQNSDGSFNLNGTMLGVAQTAQSVVEFTKLGSATTRWVPGIGAALGAGSALVASRSIQKSFNAGQPINQSDIAALVGGVAGTAGCVAALITSTGLLVPLTVVALAAGGYQLVAQAGGWMVGVNGQAVNRLPTAAESAEINSNISQLKQQNILSAPAPSVVDPLGIGTTRNSSSFIIISGAHTATIGTGGTLSDLLEGNGG